jgi:uncharacterized protein YaaW (UPF0174 family)
LRIPLKEGLGAERRPKDRVTLRKKKTCDRQDDLVCKSSKEKSTSKVRNNLKRKIRRVPKIKSEDLQGQKEKEKHKTKQKHH